MTTLRAIAVVEAVWLILVIYSVHGHLGGGGFPGNLPWDVLVINIAAEWAAPAIALVVVAWLIDQIVPSNDAVTR